MAKTPIGRNLYPKVPDMRAAETRSLSDGELFSIIENGVRLTGMLAWGGSGRTPPCCEAALDTRVTASRRVP